MSKKNETPKESLARQLETSRQELVSMINHKFSEMIAHIMECERCGTLMVADRSGRKKFCTDLCRVLSSKEAQATK